MNVVPLIWTIVQRLCQENCCLLSRAALIPLPFDKIFCFVCMKMYIFIFELYCGLVLQSESTYFKLVLFFTNCFFHKIAEKKEIRTINIDKKYMKLERFNWNFQIYLKCNLSSFNVSLYACALYILLPLMKLGSPRPLYDNSFHEAAILFWLFYKNFQTNSFSNKYL